MNDFCESGPQARRSAVSSHAASHKLPGEDGDEEQEGLELPVNPDQGVPLMPSDDGEVTAPA